MSGPIIVHQHITCNCQHKSRRRVREPMAQLNRSFTVPQRPAGYITSSHWLRKPEPHFINKDYSTRMYYNPETGTDIYSFDPLPLHYLHGGYH